ncbi:NADP-dependent oxidoreductase [Nocardioides sp. KR10-350]|uniref:NADP-dependent oxidoreductase n=1 Tax=Nocardioides cheoyonin TaxID=3156615 RepID=UPI0032B540A6
MRAIGVTEYGGPEVLHEVDVPPEELGEGEVRIRVTRATVNPTDTGIRAGLRSQTGRPEDPADVPGMEVAGRVVEVGEGVEGPAVGDRVMGIVVPSGTHGAYREEVVLPAASVVPVPAGASDAEAATLPMNGLTARLALELLGLEPGQVVAVSGAAGALGGYVIQLARADGLTVVADAAEKDEELVGSLGADVVLPRGDDYAQAIRERYPDGVDGLVDAALLNEAVLPAVKDGGTMATVRGWAGEGQDRVWVRPVGVRTVAERHDLLDRLRQQAEEGVLTLRVAGVLPAAEAPEAHRRLEAGGVRGRLVLDLT